MPYNINTNFAVEQTSNLTDTMSYANGISFKLAIDKLKFANVEYTIQTVALPDLSITGAPFNTPQRNITMAPDKVDYGTFELTFLVDEYLKNYQEIHDWMLGLVTVAEDRSINKFRDLTLQVLTSHNNVAREIVFVNAYPTNLSSLPFDTTITETNYLVANVSFNYSYFKFK
jgi:hypothetical protein